MIRKDVILTLALPTPDSTIREDYFLIVFMQINLSA